MNTSIGSPATSPFSAFSYISVDEAQTYFDTRLNTEAWDKADVTRRLKSLITATRLIDNLRFRGCKTEITQSTEFPRDGATEIPTNIKIATCECALQLLDDIDMEFEITGLSAAGDNYSTIQTTYNRNIIQEHILNVIPSAIAWRFLKSYLADINTVIVRRV